MSTDQLPGQTPRTTLLLERVAWFNRMRFIAVISMTLLSSVASALEIVGGVLPFYVLAGITLLLNLIYSWRFSRLSRARYPAVCRHVYVQIGLDLLILTAVLHFSGGSTNPFALFFLFHTFIAAQILSVRTGLVVALVSIALVAGLGGLEVLGWANFAEGLRAIDLEESRALGLLSWLFILGVALLISVYFVSTVLHQVQARDEEVRRLNVRLGQSEKLASIGTLAAGVAHEINNPVGVIRNRTEILRYRIDDGDPSEKLQAELDTIQKHTDRIGAITKGLLAFSKESPFALKRLDVNSLALEASELVLVPFASRGVELSVQTSDEEVWIMGSENHLLQVLVNVLLNARDASERGDRVEFEVSAAGAVAVLSIRDEGTGIDPADLAKIFDPFFTTKEVDSGTGLGLAISHGIVERHDGTIVGESEPGSGATFRVTLPLEA